MTNVPFDRRKLERLLSQSGMDLVLANSRHNVRYLTGGYYYHFHAVSSRMDHSRYIPFVGIIRGKLPDSFYVCRHEERDQLATEDLWISQCVEAVRGTQPTAERLIESIKAHGLARGTIGVEMPFLPADIYRALTETLPEARFLDATAMLESLRAVKGRAEVEQVRSVYSRAAESVQAAFSQSGEGDSTSLIESRVRVEMAKRGLTFLFALVSAGPGFSRAPSDSDRWEKGQILHIDAGGEDKGYVADICRTGCLGEPSKLARELHKACLAVQDATRAVIRAGVPASKVLEAGTRAAERSEYSDYVRFVVHGTGMVPHEQPRFSLDEQRPLEAGMVVSIETDFLHPDVGHLKIEEAAVVTRDGSESLGELSRQWSIQ